MALDVINFTDVYLDCLRDATIGANNASPQITYIAVGIGGGTLSAGLTLGQTYVNLYVNALPLTLAPGQVMTLLQGANSQSITIGAGGAPAGVTSVPTDSFVANFSYGIGSGIVNTPSASDTLLQNEIWRAPIAAANDGANPGEALATLLVGPSDLPSSCTLLEMSMFCNGATAALNSGTLVGRSLIYLVYTSQQTGANLQFDYTF